MPIVLAAALGPLLFRAITDRIVWNVIGSRWQWALLIIMAAGGWAFHRSSGNSSGSQRAVRWCLAVFTCVICAALTWWFGTSPLSQQRFLGGIAYAALASTLLLVLLAFTLSRRRSAVLAIAAASTAGWIMLTGFAHRGFDGNVRPILSWNRHVSFRNLPLIETKLPKNAEPLAAAGQSTVPSTAESWPQFRGPNRTAMAGRREFSTDWTTKKYKNYGVGPWVLGGAASLCLIKEP